MVRTAGREHRSGSRRAMKPRRTYAAVPACPTPGDPTCRDHLSAPHATAVVLEHDEIALQGPDVETARHERRLIRDGPFSEECDRAVGYPGACAGARTGGGGRERRQDSGESLPLRAAPEGRGMMSSLAQFKSRAPRSSCTASVGRKSGLTEFPSARSLVIASSMILLGA